MLNSTMPSALTRHRPISSGMAMDAPASDSSDLLPSGTMPVFVVGGVEDPGSAAEDAGEPLTVGVLVAVVGVEALGEDGSAGAGTVETGG